MGTAMTDKTWMLNPQGIRLARECITIVQAELDVRLKLSHPEFLQMLNEYVDLTESKALAQAFHQLLSLAGPKALPQPLRAVAKKRVTTVTLVKEANGQEILEVQGKRYPKWREGKEFRGLYRGNPVYR